MSMGWIFGEVVVGWVAVRACRVVVEAVVQSRGAAWRWVYGSFWEGAWSGLGWEL